PGREDGVPFPQVEAQIGRTRRVRKVQLEGANRSKTSQFSSLRPQYEFLGHPSMARSVFAPRQNGGCDGILGAGLVEERGPMSTVGEQIQSADEVISQNIDSLADQ